eukprot:TRINITY_DN14252_c0_g2_i4.p3 TRINITY_DN14252_c0_g2~~TRINITY_DN14252_c0_g2_i4.p3  ORF type:complete len:138 (-),score=5.32 TRINITY_DN14252_c0_g2_i4:331-744(-)
MLRLDNKNLGQDFNLVKWTRRSYFQPTNVLIIEGTLYIKTSQIRNFVVKKCRFVATVNFFSVATIQFCIETTEKQIAFVPVQTAQQKKFKIPTEFLNGRKRREDSVDLQKNFGILLFKNQYFAQMIVYWRRWEFLFE